MPSIVISKKKQTKAKVKVNSDSLTADGKIVYFAYSNNKDK